MRELSSNIGFNSLARTLSDASKGLREKKKRAGIKLERPWKIVRKNLKGL